MSIAEHLLRAEGACAERGADARVDPARERDDGAALAQIRPTVSVERRRRSRPTTASESIASDVGGDAQTRRIGAASRSTKRRMLLDRVEVLREELVVGDPDVVGRLEEARRARARRSSRSRPPRSARSLAGELRAAGRPSGKFCARKSLISRSIVVVSIPSFGRLSRRQRVPPPLGQGRPFDLRLTNRCSSIASDDRVRPRGDLRGGRPEASRVASCSRWPASSAIAARTARASTSTGASGW